MPTDTHETTDPPLASSTTPTLDPITADLLHTPTATQPIAAFIEGLKTPLAGLAYMNRNPTLWRFGIIPIILNLLATILALAVLLITAAGLIAWLSPLYPDGFWWSALRFLIALVIIALAVALALAVYMLLQGILCGHYYGKLVERIERDLGIDPDEVHEVTLAYQTFDAARDLALLLAGNITLLLFNIIPILGSILAFLGSLYWTAWIFGTDYMNHPLNLRGIPWAKRRAFNRQHRPHTLGLGAVVAVVSFIPILSSVLLTTAAAGSVLLHRRLRAAPPPAA